MLELVDDIHCVASKVESILETGLEARPSLWSQGIAHYMLTCAKLSVIDCLGHLSKQGARILINQLLSNKTEFLDSTPRSVGINLACEINSDKIQLSLDVKQTKMSTATINSRSIVPDISVDYLYNNSEMIWIRFWTKTPIECMVAGIQHLYVATVTEEVYEIYLARLKSNCCNMVSAMLELESRGADLIFCSNIAHFKYSVPLFVSNYVKFMWCYKLNRPVFNPSSYIDLRTLTTYMLMALLFINTNNLSNMSQCTHNPLIVCTGERPKQGLRKFEKDKIHITEGSRAMQIMNKSSDFGTISNYIEHVSRVELFE